MNVVELPTRQPTQAEVKDAFVCIINERLKKNCGVYTFGMYIGTICTLEKFFGQSLVYRVQKFPETRREPKAILFDVSMDLIFTHEEDIMPGGATFILDYFFSEFEKCEINVQMLREDFDRIKSMAHQKDT
jgi:hypothetical protein